MPSTVARLAFAILTAALLATTAGLASAQTPDPTPTTVPSTVRMIPADQKVDESAGATVDVTIEGVADPDGLASYEFLVSFNPTVLAFESYTNGAFLGSTGRTVQCLAPLFDIDGDGEDDPGFVRVGCVTFGLTQSGPTGDGTLGTFVFDTICGGDSDLRFDLINLGDPGASDIPALGVNGAVEINGGPCPTPTPTVPPTATPTTEPQGEPGDANCGGNVDPIDAAIILQFTAALIGSVPCPDLADVNLDDLVNALDAALVLQFVAGLIPTLPPA